MFKLAAVPPTLIDISETPVKNGVFAGVAWSYSDVSYLTVTVLPVATPAPIVTDTILVAKLAPLLPEAEPSDFVVCTEAAAVTVPSTVTTTSEIVKPALSSASLPGLVNTNTVWLFVAVKVSVFSTSPANIAGVVSLLADPQVVGIAVPFNG